MMRIVLGRMYFLLVNEACPSKCRGIFPLKRDVLNTEAREICCSGCLISFMV